MGKEKFRLPKRDPGVIQRDRLHGTLKELVDRIETDPCYEGSGCKPYKNKEQLPGEGPFTEFVAKGSKKRVILDNSNYAMYVTDNHHKSYQEVE